MGDKLNKFKKIGSAGLNVLSGIGNATLAIPETVGKAVLKKGKTTPGLLAGAAITGAAFSGIAADQDGQVDPGTASFKGAIGGTLLSAIPGAASVISGAGVATLGAGVMGMSALGTIGSGLLKAPDKNVKIGLNNLDEFKLNKVTAVPLILGSSAIKGIKEGVNAFESSRMGTSDGKFRSATPELPNINEIAASMPGNYTSNNSYSNNGGATGDLVFSLHKNR